MTDPVATPASRPSTSLLGNLRAELMRWLPFSRMQPEHVERLLSAARQAYFAPGERVLEPRQGPVRELIFIRQGSVIRQPDPAATGGSFEYATGDLLPVGALLAERAVSAVYTANADTFCLLLPGAHVQALAAVCPPWADFLNRRVAHFLELSQRAVQAAWAAQAGAEQSLATPLSQLPARAVLACPPQTPLGEALQQMHDRRVGSMLVVDGRGAPLGILTRHDILDRVTLAQRSLLTPIAELMSAPVVSAAATETFQDAALRMSRHGVRHLPVLAGDGRLLNVVSERDLFAHQQQSLPQIGRAIRAAADLPALQHAAARVRALAGHLMGQGVQAQPLCSLISHLNDLLTAQWVGLVAARRGADLTRACWLAFGSEGRSEQTVATDQDNGLAFVSDTPDADRPGWLALAAEVNDGLAACGYPLCQGGIMGRSPSCCLSVPEWQERFRQWVEQGTPEDLLNASIFFDLRPLHGNARITQPLQAWLAAAPARVPRFVKLLAENALRRTPALNWRGALDTHAREGRAVIDLKLHGTAVFVDAARVYALAHARPELGTRERLLAVGPLMRVPDRESQAWATAFDFLQLLRLRSQLGGAGVGATSVDGGVGANEVDVQTLNEIDRRMLRETLRIAHRLQQRMALDYRR